MAQVTITVPDSAYWTEGNAYLAEWNPLPGIDLGTSLSSNPNQNRHLRYFYLTIFGSSTNVHITLSSQPTGVAPDEDFSDEMEQNGNITFVNSAGASLVVEMGNDTTEPYTWSPSNSTDIRTWARATRDLSDRSLTITFDDSPLPAADAPSVTIAAVGSVAEDDTQALTANVAGGTYDGALTYAWTVASGGGSIVGNGLNAVYTPPDVTANRNVVVRVTVTATGDGATARDGTSDTSSDDEAFTVTPVEVPEPVIPPSAPGAPSVSAGGIGELSVSWFAPNAGTNPITSYDVRYRRTGTTSWTTVDPATLGTRSYTISGLSNGTTYNVQVRAVSTVNGNWSSTTSQTTSPASAEVPNTPAAPTVVVSGTSLEVSWVKPGGRTPTSYDLRYREVGGGWTTIRGVWNSVSFVPSDPMFGLGGPLEYTITDLRPGVSYDVQVRADGYAFEIGEPGMFGVSGWSASTRATIPGSAPGTTTIVSVTPGDASLLVEWLAPASDGGSAITSYDIRYRLGSSGVYTTIDPATEANVFNYTIESLVNDSEYEVQVRAVNASGNGPWSVAQTARPIAGRTVVIVHPQPTPEVAEEMPRVAPGKPTITSVGAGNHRLVVRWSEPDEEGTAPIDFYDVRIRSGPEWTLIDQASTDLEHSIRGLANNVEYDIQVRAQSAHGVGLWSDIYRSQPQRDRVPAQGIIKIIDHNDIAWGITEQGVLYNTLSLSDAWEEQARLPRHVTPVTDMFLFWNQHNLLGIHVMTEVGMWEYNEETQKFLQTQVTFPRLRGSGRGSVIWRSQLYIPVGLRVYRYTGGSNPTISLVGPTRDQGISWNGQGRIIKLVETHNDLLAAVQRSGSIGTSHVLAYNGVGWRSLWTPYDDENDEKAQVLNDIFAEDIFGEYSLWMGFEELAVIDLPTDIVNPDAFYEQRRYAPFGLAELPWFDADETNLDKIGLRVRVEVRDVSATATIRLQYALNFDTSELAWMDLATITGPSSDINDPSQHVFDLHPPEDGDVIGIIFHAIRFRVLMVSGDAEMSPDMLSLSLEFEKRLPIKWAFQCLIEVPATGYKDKSADQMVAALNEAFAFDHLVPFAYENDQNGNVIEYQVRGDRVALSGGSGQQRNPRRTLLFLKEI